MGECKTFYWAAEPLRAFMNEYALLRSTIQYLELIDQDFFPLSVECYAAAQGIGLRMRSPGSLSAGLDMSIFFFGSRKVPPIRYYRRGNAEATESAPAQYSCLLYLGCLGS